MPHLTSHDRQLRNDAKVYAAYEQLLKKLKALYQMDCIDIRDRECLVIIKAYIESMTAKYKHEGLIR